jgi:hypothetical protein
MSLQDSDITVGLRVVGNGIMDGVDITGLHGVIVVKELDGCHVVRFDECRGPFHTCAGHTDDAYGYYVHSHLLTFEEIQYVPTQEGDREDDI